MLELDGIISACSHVSGGFNNTLPILSWQLDRRTHLMFVISNIGTQINCELEGMNLEFQIGQI